MTKWHLPTRWDQGVAMINRDVYLSSAELFIFWYMEWDDAGDPPDPPCNQGICVNAQTPPPEPATNCGCNDYDWYGPPRRECCRTSVVTGWRYTYYIWGIVTPGESPCPPQGWTENSPMKVKYLTTKDDVLQRVCTEKTAYCYIDNHSYQAERKVKDCEYIVPSDPPEDIYKEVTLSNISSLDPDTLRAMWESMPGWSDMADPPPAPSAFQLDHRLIGYTQDNLGTSSWRFNSNVYALMVGAPNLCDGCDSCVPANWLTLGEHHHGMKTSASGYRTTLDAMTYDGQWLYTGGNLWNADPYGPYDSDYYQSHFRHLAYGD